MGWFSRARELRGSAVESGALEPRPQRDAQWTFEEGLEIAPGRHLLRAIGGGTRCEVHLAWDERLFALVVVKILRPERADEGRVRADLAREARLLERLAHPALVRGFGAALDARHPHLVLEHVEGPTLQRLVRREGAVALQQLLPLALHVLSALHYLAGEGVLHLDVKPGNVVMSIPPCVIDLGIARSVEEARALRHAIGTDPYMAPEQCDAACRPRIGAAADIWGAGATLFEAASGSVPFPRAAHASGSTEPAIRFPQLVADAPPLPEHLPEPFARLVARMLARDPAERPTAREAMEALEPMVAAVPERLVPARRGLLPPRTSRRVRG